MTIPADQSSKAFDEGLNQQAESLAAGLPALMVAAKRVAATVSQGVHGRRRVGQGETFWQFRRYETGDSRTSIDWRQSAKSDHLYIRETEWEAAQSVWLWPDFSGSMFYRSDDNHPTKADRVALLSMAVGWMLIAGGERLALLGSGQMPGGGRAAMNQYISAISRQTSLEHWPSLPKPEALPRYARLVLLSDFLTPLPVIAETLQGLARQGVRGHLVQVLDPAEEAFPFHGRLRFEGLEGEAAMVIGRAESLRRDYQKALADHEAGLRSIASSLGWSFARHITSQSPEAALLALYTQLSTPFVGAGARHA